MYGGVVKFCPLTAPQAGAQEWKIDFEKLEKTFTDKTKMLTLISPHNPTGKIFTDEEIKKLITILNKYPKVIVLADEVYEHMLYTTDKLPRIGSYPGMWERTVTIYSLGKTFSCTGWRVGFSVGDEKLIKPIIASQQWLNFNVNRPAQVAMAHAMKAALKPYENYPDYYAYLNHLFKTKKDDLVDMLKSTPLDFKVYEPDGGYFVMTDISNSWDKIPMKYFYKHGTSKDNRPVGNDISRVKNPDHAIDYAFSYWMTYDVGVTPVPVSCFFDNRNNKNPLEHRGTNFLRFSMCKNDETLHAAREKLKNFKI
jgi:kynurenine--oxoglutarate transaminase/cysteine-S-conjugate beta-lyase/glutamine--phenylpyruvate transaminase